MHFFDADAEMLTWRSGRAAAAGVAAVLPDEVLNEAYTDHLGGHDFLCMRYKITTAAAKEVQKRTVTKHINTVLQYAILMAIEKEVKLKHLSDIPEVVENEKKFGVISVAESNFVMKLSSIVLFLQMSTIIRSEEKAVAGAAHKLFMTPDIFRSLASHITAIQQGFDLLRSYHFASVRSYHLASMIFFAHTTYHQLIPFCTTTEQDNWLKLHTKMP